MPGADWSQLVPESDWKICEIAIEALSHRAVNFLVGGGFALAAYTGRWRRMKDADLFILPESRERAIKALGDRGFVDYYDRVPYDRGWIYRSIMDDVIVDLIWALPNRRTQVDSIWFEHSSWIELRGRRLGVIPIEELIWIKLYVFQRDRCDWPDIINLLYATLDELDWHHLINRVGGDLPLLAAALDIFTWLCPERARWIPRPVRARLGLRVERQRTGDTFRKDRIDLLDSRPWFAAVQPADRTMEL